MSDFSSSLQFDHAEPSAGSSVTTCAKCSTPIASVYYSLNGVVICERCRLQNETAIPGWSFVRGLRAIVAGGGAAIAGSLLYYAISELTGYQFGLIAILVGFFVGKAVRWGSGNRGGWRYQTIAVTLTYLAIVSTFIPPIIKNILESEPSQTTATAADASKASNAAASDSNAKASTAPREDKSPTPVEFVIGFVLFVGIILGAPFLAGLGNVLGILIILFGLYEAWKINRRVELTFSGPYKVGSATAIENPE